MPLTNGQKRAAVVAARALGLNEADRHNAQRHLLGCASLAEARAGRAGFIRLMAFYEGLADKRPGVSLGSTPDYWRRQAAAAGDLDAMRWKVRQEATALGYDEEHLSNFLASDKLSRGACRDLDTCPVYWLTRLLNALKAMRQRKEAAP